MPMTNDMVTSTIGLPEVGLAATTNNNTTQDKVTTLQDSVQAKVARLAGKGVTTVEDKGPQASYGERPERVNYASPAQLQEELGAAATYQVLTNPDGSKYQFRHNADGTYAHDDRGEWIKDTVQGNMPVRNAYIDTTKEGNYKFGLARSDVNPEVMSPWTGKPITPFEARYMNQIGNHPYKNGGNEYNGTPGPRGVTPEDGALMDISLPKALADKLEYDIHTNAGQLASRAMGQGPKTDTTTAQFGAGQSEYTTPEAPLWNVNYDMSKAKIAGNTVLPKEVKVIGGSEQPVVTAQQDKYSNLDKLIKSNRSWGDAAKDTGKQVVVGSLNAVKNLADIYGVATGDHNNWVSHTAEQAAKWYGDSYSPALKAVAENKNSEVAKGKDELEKFWIATKENFKNPMLISQLVAESAPMMAVALAGGEAIAAAKLGVSATEGMLAAGAVQQGADMGQSVIDSFFDPMKVTQKDWDKNSTYQSYIKQGMDPLEAKNKIAVDTGRVVALASGLLSYGVNKYMPGGHAIEDTLTRAKATGLVKGTLGESVTEGIEEGGGKTFQNVGLQQVNPNQNTFENVGQTTADAMAGGGATAATIKAPGALVGGIADTTNYLRDTLGANDPVGVAAKRETYNANDYSGIAEEDRAEKTKDVIDYATLMIVDPDEAKANGYERGRVNLADVVDKVAKINGIAEENKEFIYKDVMEGIKSTLSRNSKASASEKMGVFKGLIKETEGNKAASKAVESAVEDLVAEEMETVSAKISDAFGKHIDLSTVKISEEEMAKINRVIEQLRMMGSEELTDKAKAIEDVIKGLGKEKDVCRS